MRELCVFVMVVVAFGAFPAVSVAGPIDGSTPLLCAPNSLVECTRKGDCERMSPEDAQVPAFIRVDLSKNVLSSVDGSRTSPISSNQRNNGKLMIQGMQNDRVWGAVIDEQTGLMAATIGEDDDVIIIGGTCIAP